jgi:hypothetical protein
MSIISVSLSSIAIFFGSSIMGMMMADDPVLRMGTYLTATSIAIASVSQDYPGNIIMPIFSIGLIAGNFAGIYASVRK